MCDGRGGDASCAWPPEPPRNDPPRDARHNARKMIPTRVVFIAVSPTLLSTAMPPLLNDDRSRHVRMKLAEVPELARLREDLAEAGSWRDGPGLQHVAILTGRRVRHLILVRPGDRVAGGDLDRIGAEGEVADIDGDLRGGRGLGALSGVRWRFRGSGRGRRVSCRGRRIGGRRQPRRWPRPARPRRRLLPRPGRRVTSVPSSSPPSTATPWWPEPLSSRRPMVRSPSMTRPPISPQAM